MSHSPGLERRLGTGDAAAAVVCVLVLTVPVASLLAGLLALAAGVLYRLTLPRHAGN